MIRRNISWKYNLKFRLQNTSHFVSRLHVRYHSTETEMRSFWKKNIYWLHRKLSLWRLPVQNVTKISSKWQPFISSVLDPIAEGIRTVSESPKCSKTTPPSRSGSYFSVYRLSIIIDGHSAAYWAGVDGVQINDVVVTLAVLMSYWYSDFHSRLIDLLTSTGTCNLPVHLRKRAIPVQSPSTVYLTELGLDKMVNILQTTFSNEFCPMKIISFSFVFHQNLFLGVQLQ